MSDTPHSVVMVNNEVLEAEVLCETSDAPPKSHADATQSRQSRFKSHIAAWFARLKEKVFSSILVVLCLLALVYLFTQQQWMHNRFVNIDQDLQTLDQKIHHAMEQAAKAQSSVQGINSHDYAQQLEQQQSALNALKEQLTMLSDKPVVAAEQLSSLEKKLSEQIAQAAQNGSAADEGAPQAEQVAQFKSALETQIQTLQQNQQKLAAQIQQSLAQSSVAKLSLDELKKWAVKINSQWLLQAPIEQTEQQLSAFKQALGLLSPQLSYSIALLIEQDIEQLQQRKAQIAQRQIPDLSKVRQLVQEMPQPQGAINQTQSVTEQAPTLWQGLAEKLSGLVRIQKREAESVTQVEALMLHEVIQQRLLMEVDRLDYALQVSSATLIQRSIEQLNQLARAQAPAIADAIKSELLAFSHRQDFQRKPLLITKIADAAKS